jgi:hypothetical protein
MFFSEEKNQKTFVLSAASILAAMASILPRAPGIKVFSFFSSEKKTLSSLSFS